MGSTAIIAGATGLIGSALVDYLLEASIYNRVIILVRKATNIKHPKLIELVVDYDDLGGISAYFEQAVVFCALGTTMKIAKTKEAFRKVDYVYPLRLAKLAQQMGAKQLHVVTAMGTNPNSKLFYSQVKGQLELELKQLNMSSLHIYHPSLLLGNRKEVRRGEHIGAFVMRALSFLMVGKLTKYKAIHVRTIAQGMVQASLSNLTGTYIYEYNEILKFSHKA